MRGEEPQGEKSDWSELTAQHSSFTLERAHKIENEPMQKGCRLHTTSCQTASNIYVKLPKEEAGEFFFFYDRYIYCFLENCASLSYFADKEDLSCILYFLQFCSLTNSLDCRLKAYYNSIQPALCGAVIQHPQKSQYASNFLQRENIVACSFILLWRHSPLEALLLGNTITVT